MDIMLWEDGRFLDKSIFNNDHMVEIKALDSLQGMERSIVILSMRICNRRRKVGFLSDNCRMNVATSRAFHMLVLIGEVFTLNESSFMNPLLTAI